MPSFKDKKNIFLVLFFISTSLLIEFFLYQFFDSLVFKQNSPADFIFFHLSVALLSYLVFLFLYFKLRTNFIFLASLIGVTSLGIVLGIGGQLFGSMTLIKIKKEMNFF